MARGDLRFENHGYKELTRKLDGLDRKVRRTIATKALRAGAKVTVKALRSAAPKASGRGAKAIGMKIKTYRGSQVTAAISGERLGAKRGVQSKGQQTKYPGPHFHLIEYGTAERFRTGKKATERTGSPVGAFGVFGKEILAAQELARGQRTRRNRWMTKRRAVAVMRAVAQGPPTGKVVARPFFKKAFEASRSAMEAAQNAVFRREVEAVWAA